MKEKESSEKGSCCCSESATPDVCLSDPDCDCRYKSTPRDENLVRQLNNRLVRIIGQMNGIKKMVDENRYCGDILIQISAVESALQNVGYLILENHLKTCVTEKVQSGDSQVMDEALSLIRNLK